MLAIFIVNSIIKFGMIPLKVCLKDREEEEAVKDKIPLSTFQLQENGQCKHSIVDPLRQDPCSISQCTPPSLNIDSTISLVAYNKLQTFMY